MTDRQKIGGLWIIIILLAVGNYFLMKSNQKETPTKVVLSVDMYKISDIESSHNPEAISPKGARGQYQIMEPTWNECVSMMGVNWDYDTDWKDPVKNRAVGEFYMDKRIPQMLKAYKIPITVETKLACYNGGIGRVKKAWREGGESNWKNHLPQETQKYITKYTRG